MEEEKAAAYYDELSRKGEGAAKFKQGLGFSSSSINDDAAFSKPNNSNSNKLLFVKAASSSSNPNSNPQFEKESQLKSIQQKLSKNKSNRSTSSVTDTDRDRDIYRGRERRRSRSRSPRRQQRRSTHRRRSSSRERDRYRESDRDRERRVKRSLSPPPRDKRSKKGKKDGIDYAKLIHGYDKMSPAERVKEKMKLQLSETAKKDAVNAQGPGWERFDFDKDAPLDDEEIEAADDDKELVKHIGQSFRFSTVETKNEEKLKAAHDEAMFGAPSVFPQAVEAETELDEDESNEEKPVSLMSDQVLAMQQGSWRDRARKV